MLSKVNTLNGVREWPVRTNAMTEINPATIPLVKNDA